MLADLTIPWWVISYFAGFASAFVVLALFALHGSDNGDRYG